MSGSAWLSELGGFGDSNAHFSVCESDASVCAAILVLFSELLVTFRQVPDSHTPWYARNKLRSKSRANTCENKLYPVIPSLYSTLYIQLSMKRNISDASYITRRNSRAVQVEVHIQVAGHGVIVFGARKFSIELKVNRLINLWIHISFLRGRMDSHQLNGPSKSKLYKRLEPI